MNQENYNQELDKTKLDEHISIFSLHSDINEAASAIVKFRVENFYKENGNSDHNRLKGFEDERQAIANVICIAEFIRTVPQQEVVKLSRDTLRKLQKSLRDVENSLREMRNLFEEPIQSGGLEAERSILVKSARDKIAAGFHEAYARLESAIGALQTLHMSGQLDLAKQDIQRLADQNTKEGIRKHDKLYAVQARNHYIAGWFWCLVGFSGVLFAYIYGVGTVNEIESFAQKVGKVGGIPSEALISIASVRVFIFGLLTSVIFWSFRNYRLNKHNELMSRQKELALSTFTEFANAAVGDNEMRRVILGKVTSTIFDVQHLGYISLDSKESPDTAGILSAVESLIKTK